MGNPSTLTNRLHLPPMWTLVLAFVVGAVVVAWRIAGYHPADAAAVSLLSILWPGLAAVIAVYGIAWLGWALDIDS
jgi:hypothetical protein